MKPVATSVPPRQRRRGHVGGHGVVDPAVGRRRQRRAGDADAPQRREVVVVAGPEAGLLRRRAGSRGWCRGGDPGARAARANCASGRGRSGRRRSSTTVAPGQQAPSGDVPHDPGGRGVPEEPVAGRRRPGAGRSCLQLLEHDAAVPVHDALRQPGGARRSRRSTAGGRTAAASNAGSCSSATASAQASAPSGTSCRVQPGDGDRRPHAWAARPAARRRRPAGRAPCRRTGSRRRRPAPSARSGRTGRARRGCRSRARRRTTPRRSTPRRGRR